MIRRALEARGLAAGYGPRAFTPHATLLKLPRALCREMGSLDRSLWWGLRNMRLGEQPVGGLHLCWMRRPGGPPPGATARGGFYEVLLSSRLGRLVTPPDGGSTRAPPGAAVAAEAGVEELHIFDFDGTLFRTVDPEDGPALHLRLTGRAWASGGFGWLDHPASLLPPMPAARLAAFDALLARLAAARGGSGVAVVSARVEAVGEAMRTLLARHGARLPPDALHLRPAQLRGDEHKVRPRLSLP